jgi:hypothetical protein
MKCPKCGYQRLPADSAPDWQCPSCKVAYVKALQAQASAQARTPSPGKTATPGNTSTPGKAPTAGNTAAPGEIPPTASAASRSQTAARAEEIEQAERQSLAAQGQKIAIYCIVLNFVLQSMGRSHALPDFALVVLYLCIAVYSLLGVVKICSGLGQSQGRKILFMVLSFFPLINLVSLVYLNVKVTRMLREAGWTVGLLGARQ